MNRTFYDPGGIIDAINPFSKPDVPQPRPRRAAAEEKEAREEADRKARQAAAARAGRSSTLLSGQSASGVQSARKTLLGSTG